MIFITILVHHSIGGCVHTGQDCSCRGVNPLNRSFAQKMLAPIRSDPANSKNRNPGGIAKHKGAEHDGESCRSRSRGTTGSRDAC